MTAGEKRFEKRFAQRMAERGAHLKGHFLLSSGLHSSDYLQCALFLAHPRDAAWAGRILARRLAPLGADLVVSPAMGGLLIGHEVAKALGVPFLFTERVEGTMTLRRFPHPGTARFLVVEDVFTTGKSTRETAEVLEREGAVWVGAGSLVDRSGNPSLLPVPWRSLWAVSFPVYDPADCPCCREGLPLVKPGSRPQP